MSEIRSTIRDEHNQLVRNTADWQETTHKDITLLQDALKGIASLVIVYFRILTGADWIERRSTLCLRFKNPSETTVQFCLLVQVAVLHRLLNHLTHACISQKFL